MGDHRINELLGSGLTDPEGLCGLCDGESWLPDGEVDEQPGVASSDRRLLEAFFQSVWTAASASILVRAASADSASPSAKNSIQVDQSPSVETLNKAL